MGIEPTWDLVESHAGFEDQERHQVALHLHLRPSGPAHRVQPPPHPPTDRGQPAQQMLIARASLFGRGNVWPDAARRRLKPTTAPFRRARSNSTAFGPHRDPPAAGASPRKTRSAPDAPALSPSQMPGPPPAASGQTTIARAAAVARGAEGRRTLRCVQNSVPIGPSS